MKINFNFQGQLMLDGLLAFLHCLKPEVFPLAKVEEAKVLQVEAKARVFMNALRDMKLPYDLVTLEVWLVFAFWISALEPPNWQQFLSTSLLPSSGEIKA